MANPDNAERYDVAARWLHWITVALVVLLVVTGKSGIEVDEPGSRGFFWHSSLGVLLVFVVVERIVWALVHRGPAFPESMSRMNRVLAHATHAALYLLLFALPVSGWLAASAEGATVSAFGTVSLPRFELRLGPQPATAVKPQQRVLPAESEANEAPVKHESKDPENSMGELHETLGNLLLIVVGLHILAALAHQYYWRDGILERMLPRRTRADNRPTPSSP